MKHWKFWYTTFFFCTINNSSALNSVWRWECIDNYCEKKIITNETEADSLSLSVCRLKCSHYAAIWPKPTGVFITGTDRNIHILNVNNISIMGYEADSTSTKLFYSAGKIFQQEIFNLTNGNITVEKGKSLSISINVQNYTISRLMLTTDESYVLNITNTNEVVNVDITASNFFGTRHALTTLAQLIVFDDLRNQIVILSDVYISDGPAYPYRGILLDTSRSYIKIDVIKSILRGMGASKLNHFHWHITDSQSFPFVSKSHPELSEYGAYSPHQVYTDSMIQEIVSYALERGVRVIPELDAPAHVGEGWQNTGFVTCFNWQPYSTYCMQPPCGQFDPTQDGLYEMLDGIYGDMLDQFNPDPDVFHIGGDEVNFHCWNSTENIVEWMQENNYDLSENGFVNLWDHYLNKSVNKLYQRIGKEIPLITWQSSLTNPAHLHHLSKDRYIIQIWLNSTILTTYILGQGFNIIISNFNAMYLDCGYGSWYDAGDGYCSYNSWKSIYNNTPEAVAGVRKTQVIGNEVAFWTEQGGSEAAETRIWPRAAALAEVVWSEPEINSWQEAEQRFMVQWERLVHHGVKLDAPQPEWCLQNEENCRIGSHFYSS